MTFLLCIDFTWPGWTGVSAAASLITAIIAGLYTFYTYHLLKANKVSIDKQMESMDRQRKLTEYEVYNKIAEKIDDMNVQKFIQACVAANVVIEENAVQVFLLGENIIVDGVGIRTNILVPFTDLAIFWKSGLITTDMILSGFGFLLLTTCNSKAVMSHIQYRQRIDGVPYEALEELYSALYQTLSAEKKKAYAPNFSLK